jgi:hypothetical protein
VIAIRPTNVYERELIQEATKMLAQLNGGPMVESRK